VAYFMIGRTLAERFPAVAKGTVPAIAGEEDRIIARRARAQEALARAANSRRIPGQSQEWVPYFHLVIGIK
jgi:hypothetical protein